MKSSVRVCLHRKSSEWKESQALWSLVGGTWEFKVNQDQYLYGHEGQ